MIDFKRFTLFVLLAALVLTSCAARNPHLTTQQQVQVNLYASLDLIATANRDVAKTMVALNATGNVPDPVTRAVLGYNQQVADASRGALDVLDSNQSPQQKAQAVLDTLRKLDLPPAVREFVNSNPTAAAAIAVVNSIVTIQQAVARVTSTPPALLDVNKGGM